MLLCHLATQILQHSKELLVGNTATLRHRCYCFALLLVVVAILRNHHLGRLGYEGFASTIYRYESIVLDILVDKSHNESLTHYR